MALGQADDSCLQQGVVTRNVVWKGTKGTCSQVFCVQDIKQGSTFPNTILIRHPRHHPSLLCSFFCCVIELIVSIEMRKAYTRIPSGAKDHWIGSCLSKPCSTSAAPFASTALRKPPAILFPISLDENASAWARMTYGMLVYHGNYNTYLLSLLRLRAYGPH